jgi:hypothetical protein
MDMDAGTLHLAPKAIRLAVARALLGKHAVDLGNTRRRDIATAAVSTGSYGLMDRGDHAAACSAWARAGRVVRGGKSAAPSGTDLHAARLSSGSRRHSGMKFGFFQLSIVVSGKPVSRAISAEPPSASMI